MQPLQEKLRQLITRESLVTFCLYECLAGDVVVMCYMWYCSRDVNALPPKVNESPNNKMDIFNLGVIFGPTLMWNSESTYDSLNLALDLLRRSSIVEILLFYYNDIFC